MKFDVLPSTPMMCSWVTYLYVNIFRNQAYIVN